jgi:hypothetical protein
VGSPQYRRYEDRGVTDRSSRRDWHAHSGLPRSGLVQHRVQDRTATLFHDSGYYAAALFHDSGYYVAALFHHGSRHGPPRPPRIQRAAPHRPSEPSVPASRKATPPARPLRGPRRCPRHDPPRGCAEHPPPTARFAAHRRVLPPRDPRGHPLSRRSPPARNGGTPRRGAARADRRESRRRGPSPRSRRADRRIARAVQSSPSSPSQKTPSVRRPSSAIPHRPFKVALPASAPIVASLSSSVCAVAITVSTGSDASRAFRWSGRRELHP